MSPTRMASLAITAHEISPLRYELFLIGHVAPELLLVVMANLQTLLNLGEAPSGCEDASQLEE